MECVIKLNCGLVVKERNLAQTSTSFLHSKRRSLQASQMAPGSGVRKGISLFRLFFNESHVENHTEALLTMEAEFYHEWA